MRFRNNADLDTSQISDRRGGRGRTVAGGGGLVGIVVLVFSIYTGTDLTGLVDPGTSTSDNTNLAAECQSGSDANSQEDCRIVGVVNSVQAYWKGALTNYSAAQTVFFDGGTQTGCGSATAATGPFYCPSDQTIYIDLSFYDALQTNFGASGGPFAEAYVIAHEYGHHVQDLSGVLDRANDGSTGPASSSVRTELQADCYAGVWAKNALNTGLIEELTETDIADGLNAAAAIGDDRIQQQAQGRVDPESWTHGSSEARQRWFTNGYSSGNTSSCNTFATEAL